MAQCTNINYETAIIPCENKVPTQANWGDAVRNIVGDNYCKKTISCKQNVYQNNFNLYNGMINFQPAITLQVNKNDLCYGNNCT